MRICLIARMDNSGLGSMSREFADYFKPEKVLLVENKVFQTFPERYSGDIRKAPNQFDFGDNIREWMTKDIDVIVAIETPYDWSLFQFARQRGVKTALVTMVEMTDRKLRGTPDLFICPSKLDFQEMPEPKVFLQFPVNIERLAWKKREKAKLFIHSASHWGMAGRKGTALAMKAMDYVESDVKLRVYSWQGATSQNAKVEIVIQNFKNYWQMWREGDVLVYPQNFNGICLPIVEAMSSGMGVITTDIFPFNEYMPKELLFSPKSTYKTRINSGTIEVDAAEIDPKDIARKIDEVANMDLSGVSEYGKRWAEDHSWEKLGIQWRKALEL